MADEDVAVHARGSVSPGIVVDRLDDLVLPADASHVTACASAAIAGAPASTSRLVFDAEAITQLDAFVAHSLDQDVRSIAFDAVAALIVQPTESDPLPPVFGEHRDAPPPAHWLRPPDGERHRCRTPGLAPRRPNPVGHLDGGVTATPGWNLPR